MTDIKEQDKLKTQSHLIAYDILKSSAAWLEDSNNEVFSLLEFDGDSLKIAAKASIIAAAVLKKAALDIQLISGIEDSNKYEDTVVDKMQEIQAMANELDETGDERLMKRAGLLDEILVTLASGTSQKEELIKRFDKKIEEIKAHGNKSMPAVKVATEPNKKEEGKKIRPLEAPLKTRYCPDHPGSSLVRIRDGLFYCIDCSKQFDFDEGFTTAKGNKVPGTSVQQQTSGNLTDISIPTMFQEK